jgi:hypothetical protein
VFSKQEKSKENQSMTIFELGKNIKLVYKLKSYHEITYEIIDNIIKFHSIEAEDGSEDYENSYFLRYLWKP